MAKKTRPKYIFVVGGVLSGVGKGVTSASIGAIMKAKGFKTTALKADPYINVDAGTMNPIEHGEVFVTDDKDETDQDMGNYERFLDIDLTSINYMTTGRVYQTVINNERSMKYKGRCVQVVPHIPEEIIARIKRAQKLHDAEIVIIEIGGTVGEYENILFLEAARELQMANPGDVAVVLVSYLPVPAHLGEMKTKPTQHASRLLNQAGLQADMIIARGRMELDKPRREKLATFCGVPKEHCISAPDVPSIYEIPTRFEEQQVGNKLLKTLDIKPRKTNLAPWQAFVKKIHNSTKEVKIAVVGKYFGTGSFTLADSYISVIESVKHAAWFNNVKPVLEWVDSEEFEKDAKKLQDLKKYDGIIVPGGFGTRGIEGIISTIQFAREKKIPYLGLCYGMQLATIEFARHVLDKKGAHTVEVNEKTKYPIIIVNPFQAKNIAEEKYGGTMRLGAYDCDLKIGTKTQKAYGAKRISERHRHRYEFNNEYREEMDNAGLKVVGVNPESDLVEIVELENHPFFVGTQFHPEFKSRPMRPHPLFREFVKAAKK
ncbi:MAG: CTP synthetase [Candidatus Magasanikbacteria bacterium GW2011_GWD2_43_18]|uniref:CTP synthase n=1 Tax=Candidatus Magasanikbacteria bacterium GW2011_GWE2_42_7 TaxID=1619052 RepID=A0A0G1DGV9_9BACT|nr:MAG: CTP synthetase [Candidatus Magasanikbacteria bacterium GW2011_GWC2_42_27]KKS70046.1 MAG: CTP synthetase [Candidatus Magasanikbacteria bacterium GW2011_GWE2_42_7]KKT04442.1 MAG: CTP synthetase [Candidatus Magasanikbacteria bacterium GW2011_GWD2_43_18]HBB37669.1 CTP synthase [Candidatus Magasanikbacteria bacterium]HCC13668.1 CTP synthase [Candidatus Magasanikbacteria bacterium]